MKVSYNSKLIILILLFVVTVLLGIIGFTYAFFKAGVEGNENATNTVIQSSTLKLVFTDTQTITLSNIFPGATSSKTFTVENVGTSLVEYNIKLINVNNTFINDELVYEITSTNEGGNKTETPLPSSDSKILESVISPGVTQTYTIKVIFKETYLNQNANQGAEFTGKLQVDTKELTYNKIIADNTPQSDASINFDSTTGNGLYYTSDNTYGEDNTRIYYYRGRVDNNWVAFGGFLWRIVRTTSEGGVKLVYSGDGSTTSSGFIGASIEFNYPNYDSKYNVGYTYNTAEDGYTGAQTNSTVKIPVDTWYTNNLSSYASYLSDTAIYCADRSSERVNGSNIYYPTIDRIYTNKKPTYACSSTNASRYTVSTETGNGYLQKPIALLTADELNYAGVRWGTASLNSYIMDNTTSSYWWTMSPYFKDTTTAYVFAVNNTGNLTDGYVFDERRIRPVVSLKPSVMFIGGDGSKLNPYIVDNI